MIVTGISGSGKSTAIKSLDDLGFFCVDNLPSPLIAHFVEFLRERCQNATAPEGIAPPKVTEEPFADKPQGGKYALRVDCHDEKLFPCISEAREKLNSYGVDVSLLFLDCIDEVAIRRFRETRRPHPLLLSHSFLQSIVEALTKERELLADLRESATLVIDTSNYTPHELRRAIEEYTGQTSSFEVVLESFGYRYGIPYDSDLVMDVRFLPNPHFVPDLQPLTGVDGLVASYVWSAPESLEFLTKYLELFDFLLPKYKREGKRFLRVAVGCTGGRHRSVAVVERLTAEFSARGLSVLKKHRDMLRGQ